LSTLLGEGTKYLPVPWSSPSTIDAPTRVRARAELALPRDAQVCLYAGNLDGYQGWERLVEAIDLLRRTHPRAVLLVATESEPGPARIEAERRGVADRTRFCRLDTEHARAFVHAASDLTWVPRRTEGGIPIKMLDAFSRQLPVVAMARATAGLPVTDACVVTPNDDGSALAEAARTLLDDRASAAAMCARAAHYLETEHGVDSFTEAMCALLSEARPSLQAKPAARPRSEAWALRAR
jgi:glycosyltransferase involved in cell wall biosynthesis